MIRLSASALARAEKCPASASLPQVRELHADAEAGTAEHKALEAETPADERAEVAYAFNPETGAVRECGSKLDRNYPVDWETEIPGTVDRVRVDSDCVHVRDHKTGFGYMVAPAKRNLQLAHGAVCASAVAGVDTATVTLGFSDKPDDIAELDAFDLAAARERIRAIWRRVKAPTPDVATGDHCWRCPCVRNCPAHLTMAVAFTEGIWPNVMPSDGLTVERVAQGWEHLKNAKRVLGLVESTYRAFASQTPVPLASGKVLAAHDVEREELDGLVAFQTLRDLHGEAIARAAVSMEATKASLERAIGPIAPARGRAKLVREALDALRASNGVVVKRGVRVEEFSPEEK